MSALGVTNFIWRRIPPLLEEWVEETPSPSSSKSSCLHQIRSVEATIEMVIEFGFKGCYVCPIACWEIWYSSSFGLSFHTFWRIGIWLAMLSSSLSLHWMGEVDLRRDWKVEAIIKLWIGFEVKRSCWHLARVSLCLFQSPWWWCALEVSNVIH